MAVSCGVCSSEWDTYGVFISCYGCGANFHGKCVKIKASISDILNGATANGLEWFCTKCRKTSTGKMLTKLEKCKIVMNKIKDAASDLMGLISSQQLELDTLTSTVETAVSSKPCPNKQSMAPVNPAVSMPVHGLNTDVVVSKPPDLLHPPQNRRTRSTSCHSEMQSSVPAAGPSPTTASVETPDTAVSLLCKPASTAASPSLSLADGCSATVAATSNGSSPANDDPALLLPVDPIGSLHKTKLKVVVNPPRKHIFISRLASSTTEDDIMCYIRESCRIPDSDLFCRKFEPPSPRVIASFKIVVPEQFFENVSNKSFWPKGTLVREFKPRQSKITKHKPVIIEPSKNLVLQGSPLNQC